MISAGGTELALIHSAGAVLLAVESKMDDNEVIAVLLAGYDDDGQERVTVVLRDAQGQVSLKHMSPRDAAARRAMSAGCFREGRPILDPVSREVMGYELEQVTARH